MAIQYLNTTVLQSALIGAWQNNLGTTQNPANGKWYTNGANNDGVGLYGGLTDQLPISLNFSTANQVVTNVPITAMQAIGNNLNGNCSNFSSELTYSYTDTTSYSQTVTSGINSTVLTTVGITAEFVEASATFSTSFNYSVSTANSTIESQTMTYKTSVTPTIPAGKVYQAVLTASQTKVTAPYTAAITVTGTTETWFEDTVNGHYNYKAQASEAFPWINEYNTAGSDSSYFGSGSGQGTYSISGTLTYTTTCNFTVTVYDITAAYQANPAAYGGSSPPAPVPSQAIGTGPVAT